MPKLDMRTAEDINAQYALELCKLNKLMSALSQQQDIVMDLHYKYVKAVTKATQGA